MPFDAREATISTVQHAIFSGLSSCREVTLSFLARAKAINPEINAIITLDPTALDTAVALDDAFARGNTTGALFCVPIFLKDNFDTADVPTTGGCLDLAGSTPSTDAPSVAALKRAGAVVLGKANLHELALEGLTVSSLGGQTLNPYDLTRTPGGSSGGSAAAVAASLAVFATGSDTVNSLRSPASANSLFSCRPTRGRVSRSGIIPISYTQDAIGAIGRCVYDVATALMVMQTDGYDAADNTTALIPSNVQQPSYVDDIEAGTLKGLRLGVIEGFFNRTANAETTPVNDAIGKMMDVLTKAGAIIVPVNDKIYNATAISQNLDVQRFEYRQEMNAYLSGQFKAKKASTLHDIYNSGKFLVIPSQYEYVNTALVSSTSNATYDMIKQGIQNLTLALQETFTRNDLDAMVYPEQKNLVVKVGASSQSGRNGILAALTGSPVVTVPAGFSEPSKEAPRGVPIGMEILGRPWTESKLFQIAYQIEKLTHVRRIPALAESFVEVGNLTTVPVITPNVSNIPQAYPIGVL
ncbi:MAG: hypothetical protein M1828_001898 [Chrysothrix sp. TS-e1954]|nr:MAG: hypothetical protein M1828_001898 [Chrysothrix sp. TS-e1954]